MTTLLHMTTSSGWERAQPGGEYVIESLETEGFIHCSLPQQVAGVANTLYAGRTDLILLHIDADRVKPEIRYEGNPEAFPHIYGPLNVDAVLNVTPYPPGPDGTFLPPDI